LKLPVKARVVEVGPRDGLQNETRPVPTEAKVGFIRTLAEAGLPEIEITSFVHPRWVPQLADAAEVVAALEHPLSARFTALVPNLKGAQRAVEAGLKRVAVFIAASESFSQKNTNRSIQQGLEDVAAVVECARQAGVSVRAYVSTVWFCPYEGRIGVEAVLPLCRALVEMGIEEISLGDTVGLAVPTDVDRTLDGLLTEIPVGKLALHLHDTSGTALANAVVGLERGVTCFDASAGGLGGCPYAPGASGNLATEDLVYALERMGVETGVDLATVARASRQLAPHIDHPLPSRQLQRLASES
jgi:hydroxymethylglutaryl-CoA lyase